jgi:HlyD family secretion protein
MDGNSVWVRDIVSKAPSWPVRYGNLAFLMILIAALATTWFIKYPDVVRAPVIFRSDQAPVRVVSPTSRTIDRLFAQEKQNVEAGTPLVLLDNAARYESIQRLEQWHDEAGTTLQAGKRPDAVPPIPTGLRVGPVQDGYMSVMQRLSDYKTFVADPSRADKRAALESRATDHEVLAQTYQSQIDIVQQRLQIKEDQYNRNRKLSERGMVPSDRVEELKSQVLNLQFQLRDLQTNLANNRIQAARTRSELADLQQTWSDRDRTLRLMFLNAFEQLENRLKEWRQTYLVTAPLSGQVTYFDVIQPGHHVNASQAILAVVPVSDAVSGSVLLPTSSVGDVSKGQDVLISLDSPSSEEVGKVRGVISDVSLVSGEKTYRVRVELPDGLVTEFGHELNFRQEMPGTAEIVTEDHRLLMRVLNWLRVLLSSNVDA